MTTEQRSDGPVGERSERPWPGDWVTVYAQVVEGETHPDDLRVEMFSHNEQYDAIVRRDHCVHVAPPIQRGIARRCTSLFAARSLSRETTVNDNLVRCASHEDHGGLHEGVRMDGSPWSWSTDESAGDIEERP